MNEQETITPDSEETSGAEMPGCGGPDMAKMMKECLCGTMFKKHRLGLFLVFSLVILAFLISQVGGILGIIAFIRTL